MQATGNRQQAKDKDKRANSADIGSQGQSRRIGAAGINQQRLQFGRDKDRGLTMGLFGKKKDSTVNQDKGGTSVALSDGSSVTVTATVDCIGDSCPRPQLMTRKAVGSAGAGDVVAVLIDNPTSMEAIPPMCPEIGATHLETLRQDRGWQVLVRKD
ncbi:MAG: sulfurtransferase TusA family protein [Pseudomonadota bacterium]|nr:sulfurtransferase TusA family protein [Pseudomonadota bacterium]